MVTWHIPSGTCRTGALNERARNKLTGTFNGNALALTAGTKGAHILALTVSGTVNGDTATRTYKISIGDVTDTTPDVFELCEVEEGSVEGASAQADSVSQQAKGPVPETPELSLTAGDGEIALSWTVDDGGSPITQHRLKYLIDGVELPETRRNLPAGPFSYTLDGLTNARMYEVAVRARNANGWGDWSNWVPATPVAKSDDWASLTPVPLKIAIGDILLKTYTDTVT